MRPREYDVYIAALIVRVALCSRLTKSSAVAIFITSLISPHRVELVVFAEDVVPADHRLLIIIASMGVADEVTVQRIRIGAIRRRVIRENLLANRTDAILRNHIAGELITDVGLTLAHRRGFSRLRSADMRG